jgi:2-dehydropantoate 2-reductase
MRIAVMGAGGLGGCLGAHLAKGGNDVTLIARGAHLEAIRKNGLRLKSHNSDFTVDAAATDDPSQVGPVDLVLFAVKTYHNSEAIPLMKPLVGEGPAIITLQNGVESYEELGNAFGIGHMMPGAAYLAAIVQEPGVILQESENARVAFGEINGSPTPRAVRVHETMLRAGLQAELSRDVIKSLWTKFLLLAPVSGITSSKRTRIHQLLESSESRANFLAAMKEVEAVGRAMRVELDEDIVQTMFDFIQGFDDFQNSMHTDVELGRPLELEALSGAVVRLGRKEGVSTPVNEQFYSDLLPYINGARE